MTRVAVVGCGKQAEKHVVALQRLAGVEVVLADVVAELAERLGKRLGVRWVSEAAQVFDHAVDAIDICTPTPTHAELIRRALSSGKHFFCEKPLCENLDEARTLSAASRSAGRIGMVGYIYRFAPVFELAKSLFPEPANPSSPVLGRVAAANFRLGGRGSHALWKHRRDRGGGAINEMLVHMVDLAVWYLGPVDAVRVHACELRRPRRTIRGTEHEVDAEDYVSVEMRMANGARAMLQADLLTPAFTQLVEIQGDNGTFMGSIQPDMPSFLFLLEPVEDYRPGKTPLDFGPRDFFGAQMADFIRSVEAGTPPSRSTLEDSVLVMEAMEMIKEQIG